MSEQPVLNDSGSDPVKRELPEFTLRNVLADIVHGIRQILFNPELNNVVIPGLLILELLAVKLIRGLVPYTEIDYKAYMEQIKLIKAGELNYNNIYGGTGPLVYPAGHVWFYSFFHWITNDMKDIYLGQAFFSYIYVATQLVVGLIYINLNLPPWVSFLLVLSKRLHSIYVLRMFNDSITTLFSALMVLTLQYAAVIKTKNGSLSKTLTNVVAPVLYSFAISIKMNALLYMPGFLLVTYFLNDEILLNLAAPIALLLAVNVLVAYHFLFSGELIRESYFLNAFNFKRKFLYKWTVNWKFLDEEAFSSDEFHKVLLYTEIGLILIFLFTKWATKDVTGKSTFSLIVDGLKFWSPTLLPSHIINDPALAARYVVGVLTSCNFIGIITARSLHYQFLSWYCWTLPFLLYHSNFFFLISMLLFAVHEWCWNVYPATKLSSEVLLSVNIFVLLGYWANDKLYKREISQTKKNN